MGESHIVTSTGGGSLAPWPKADATILACHLRDPAAAGWWLGLESR
jgi:hypothetical protein